MKKEEAVPSKKIIPGWSKDLIMILWVIVLTVLFFRFFRIDFKWLAGMIPEKSIDIGSLSMLWAWNIWLIFAMGMVNILAWKAGCMVLKWTKTDFREHERNLVAAAIGFGIIAFSVFFLGLIGILYKQLLWLFPVAGLAVLAVSARNNSFTTKIKISWGSHWYWVFSLSAMLLLSLLGCLTPETFYDSLNYHLAAPDQYLIAHGIFPIYWNLYSFIPANIGMIFTVGLAVGGDVAAKLLNFGFLVWIVYFIYGFVLESTKNKGAALFGAVIFISPPMVLINSWKTGVEFGIALFVLGALICLLRYIESVEPVSQRKYLMLCGVLLGLTMGSKYTGLLPAIATGVVVILVSYRQPRKLLKDVILLSGISIMFVSPWLIRNAVVMKNPVYPFMSSVFDSKDKIAKEKIEMLVSEASERKFGGGIARNLAVFWKITMKGYDDSNFIGLIYLALLPLLFMNKNVDRRTKWTLVYLGLMYVLWSLTTGSIRYFLPWLAIPAALIAICMYHAGLMGSTVVLLKTFVGVMIWTNIFWALYNFNGIKALKYLAATISRAEYLSDTVFGYPSANYRAFEYINAHTDPDSRVLFIGDARTFNVKRLSMGSSVFDENPLLEYAENASTGRNLAENLKKDGITHIYFNLKELDRTKSYGMLDCDETLRGVIDDFWKSHLKLLLIPVRYQYIYMISVEKVLPENSNLLNEFYYEKRKNLGV